MHIEPGILSPAKIAFANAAAIAVLGACMPDACAGQERAAALAHCPATVFLSLFMQSFLSKGRDFERLV